MDFERAWPDSAHSARSAMPSQESWAKAMGEISQRRRSGPARCFLMLPGSGRADEIARRVAHGAPEHMAAIVSLEFTELGGSSSLDGEYFRPRAPRHLYDQLVKRAVELPSGHLRILSIDAVHLADLPSANVLRALMLEEPRHFDAIVASGEDLGPAMGLLGPLCKGIGP